MIPIILCGGSGTRLWPVSAKPFHKFFEQSLFEMTLKRLEHYEQAIIVSQESLRHPMEIALKKHKNKARVIYEPESKDTAPAVALVCHLLSCEKQSKEVIGIFPSDHFIGNEPVFHEALSIGAEIAAKDKEVVTLGLIPSHPKVSYGYIKVSNTIKQAGRFSVKKAISFLEKPDFSKAKALLEEDRDGYLWNSGIFLCRVDILISHFKTHLPDLWEKITKDGKDISAAYRDLSPVSFDRGIMEKTGQHICLACNDIDWVDLGSWDHIAEWKESSAKSLNNKAYVASEKSEGNFVFSSKNQPVGLVGIKDTLIVNGEEGILVAKKGMSESVKKVAWQMKQKLPSKGERRKECPWGEWSVIGEGEMFKCKILQVKPGHQLSYQTHQKRMEHWIVMSGKALVILDGKSFQLNANEHILIPQGAKHRLKNPGTDWLTVFEIQMGNYLGEDDIIRYLDDYGRSSSES